MHLLFGCVTTTQLGYISEHIAEIIVFKLIFPIF